MIEYTELARRRSSDAATSSGPEKRFDDPAAAAAAAGCRRSSAFKPILPFVAGMESARVHGSEPVYGAFEKTFLGCRNF